MRILLVEDDASQAESIQVWLEMDGYSVDWVARGDHALQAIQTHEYACILLDRGLPKLTGDQVLHALRQQHDPIPVILITAQDAIADRVAGLDLGANDYLVKPFSLEELSARVRAQMRQHQQQRNDQLSYGDLLLDLSSKMVNLQGQVHELTAKEFQILQRLMQNPKHIITREQLEEAIYAWGDETGSNTIEVFIYQLRKKLGSQRIVTVRGLGYRMGDVT